MRARAPLVLAVTAVALAGCATKAPQDDSARMASLKDRLHERLEEAAAKEPLVASAFADRGQVALAIRSASRSSPGAWPGAIWIGSRWT